MAIALIRPPELVGTEPENGCKTLPQNTLSRGVEQIAHGSLFGYVDTVNYLVATVTPKEMHLELKRLAIILEGGELPQSAGNRPREIVRISDEEKRAGFRSVGTLTIDKRQGQPRHRDKSGEFARAYDPAESGQRPAVEIDPGRAASVRPIRGER